MNLDEKQKKSVATWIDEGAKLAEIQKRLGTEFGLTLTYMEVRMLVDDLKVMPKDPPPPPEPPKATAPALAPAQGQPNLQVLPDEEAALAPDGAGTPDASSGLSAGRVTVTVDRVTRPGALVSGGVTFRDGVTAQWQLDQAGRMGLSSSQPGYKPSAADVQAFQLELDKEFQRLGL